MKTGRNEPCPCGSGKKYKKCCDGKNIAAVTADYGEFVAVEEQSDILSNKITALIHSGKYEEAKQGCEQLLTQYPELLNGNFLYANLYEKMGDIPSAIHYLEKCLASAKNNPQFFDPETVDFYQEEISRLKKNGN